ncbi:MAG TPA: hypothetical protein PKZ02_02170 [Candidatus Paceibacterota bacterium]|nr:hypothetical protein [Candidatus Paceibacterota bacterium]
MQSIAGNSTIPDIIDNREQLYEGDLVHYFQAVFFNAQNLTNPYHNFRHMFHTLWLCYQACVFYKRELTPREMRNLLIAAMFHDFDHSGMMGNDDLNIERAIRGLEKHLAQRDKAYFDDICEIIWATEFPHKSPSKSLPLLAQIIRDANVAQGFSVAWIQQVIFGLAKEWGKKPIEIIAGQCPFLSHLDFVTEWAQQTFTPEAIKRKISEARALQELLERKVPD